MEAPPFSTILHNIQFDQTRWKTLNISQGGSFCFFVFFFLIEFKAAI